MSHQAFRVSCLKQLDKLKISCIGLWEEKVVVGASDGSVRLYEAESSSGVDDQKQPSFKPSMSKPNIGKNITQVLCLPQQSLLLGIVDSYLQVYSLPSLNLKAKLENSKGCFIMACNQAYPVGAPKSGPAAAVSSSSSSSSPTVPLMVAVALRRRIVVYRWEMGRFQQHTEVAVSHSTKTMVFTAEHICVGTSVDYQLIDVRSRAVVDIFPIAKKGVPLALQLPDEELLLVKGSEGICVGWDGKPTRDRPIPFREPPVMVMYVHPYIIVVLSNLVEVRNLVSKNLTQTFRLKGGKFGALSESGYMVLASTNFFKDFRFTPWPQQIEELVHNEEFAEALSLVQIPTSFSKWESKRQERFHDVQIEYAYHLFNNYDFQTAMMYFQQADTDPRQVLALFTDVLPSGQCKNVRHPVQVKPIQGQENLLQALSALIPYLAQYRARLVLAGNSSVGSHVTQLEKGYYDDAQEQGEMALPVLVDTVLLKSYLLTDASLVMSFLNKNNQCDIQECQYILRKYERYPELVVLYRSRGYHKNALELLATLGQSGNQLSPLYGTEETVKYLQMLSEDPQYLPLVLEFSLWVLQRNPDSGLRIFTHAHTAPRAASASSNAISPHIILDHLKKHADQEICIGYLESLISKCHEPDATFHNELIFLYLNGIMKELQAQHEEEKAKGTVPKRMAAGTEPGRVGILRKKLLALLETSVYYVPETILTEFPFDELLEERAVLLSRIGQHSQALSIYVHKLHDLDTAERYCQQFYERNPSEGRSVYLQLLHLYLKPPDNQPPLIEAAQQVLAKYNDRIDAVPALELLPGDLKMKMLFPFFSAVLRGRRQQRRDFQIIKHLRRAENLQVRIKMHEAQLPRVRIDDTTQCQRCHNLIGSSAFHRYPNGVVVHYICSDDKYVCPVTGVNFKQQGSSSGGGGGGTPAPTAGAH